MKFSFMLRHFKFLQLSARFARFARCFSTFHARRRAGKVQNQSDT